MKKMLKLKFLIAIWTMCLFSITVSAQTQNVTINVKNASLRQVFKVIEKQTTYRFSYRDAVIDSRNDINASFTSQPVPTVLDAVLKGRNLGYRIVSSTSIVITDKPSSPTNAKQKSKGRVLDSKGEPVIGATIMQKGSKNGTVTDYDGNFVLDVDKGTILVISYIGCTTKEIPVSDNMEITLEDNTLALDDVVVIGYGTARKSDLTGSMTQVGSDRLKDKVTARLSTALQGEMSGVQVTRSNGDPSQSATIRVRGVTTISTNDPLVIIDGVPARSIDDVSTEDVESIQVLKDAASASIYGSRAAAGVILITTKRAKTNEFSLSYNMEYGIDTPTAMPKFGNAVEWMTGLNELKYNDGASSLYSAYTQEFIENYAQMHQADPDSYPDTNWMGYLKSSKHHQKHTIGLTGGTEKLKTNLSLSYYDTEALYEGKDYQKLNVRVNNDYQINNWIHANVDFNVVYSRTNTPFGANEYTALEGFTRRAPIYAAYWSDGSLADAKDGDNQLAALKYGGGTKGDNYILNSKFQLDVTPFKGLTISAVIAPNKAFYKGKTFRTKYKVRRLNGDMIYGTGFGSTDLTETRNDNYSLTKQFFANYKLRLDHHSFSAMAGYEDYTYSYENESAQRNDYSLNNFPYLDLGSSDKQYNSGGAGHNAYRSVFGRIMYSYADRYLLQANVRSDGSSRFAKGHRWGTFPSVSAGWVISEEPWFKKGTLSYLKLRASIGKLGNERIGSEFPYQALLTFGTTYLPNSTGGVDALQSASQIQYAFNDITWETTTTYGAGADLAFFSDRLRFSFDYYYKKTTDMLLEIGFPSYFGYNSPVNNVADMHTRGWDVELSWRDHIGDFSYGANFNISDYRSKMGYMADKQVISDNKLTEEGSYYNEWYGYRNLGIILNEAAMTDADGNPIAVLTKNDGPGNIRYADINEDGNITASGDRVRLGNSMPELMYGGSLWANWKDFDFNLSFQGIGHQLAYIKSSWVNAYEYQTTSIPELLVNNHWSPYNTDEQNAQMKYPKLTSNTANTLAMSDFYLFNGAYMRIKNITLGYTIPAVITSKFKVKKLRVYFSASDLPAFSNYPKGYDPEYGSGDYLLSSYVFGFNISL